MTLTSQDLLKEEYQKRCLQNSSYSLREFSKDLGINKTSISAALKGERELSKSNLEKFYESISTSPQESVTQKLSKLPYRIDHNDLDLISDWYYFAILNILKLKNDFHDLPTISQKLNLPIALIAFALARLEKMGLVTLKEGIYFRTSRSITTGPEKSSHSIKKHHESLLEKAKQSLFQDPLHLRDFSSITMPISLGNFQKAKKIIKKFKREIAEILEDKNADQVYTLSVQLFPLTKIQKDIFKDQ